MSPLNTEEWARKKTEGGEARGVRGLPALTGFEVGGKKTSDQGMWEHPSVYS